MEDIRSVAKKNYCDFIIEHGIEPAFARCTIKYKDDNTSFDSILALSSDSTPNNENQVFFYCDSFEDLLSLTEDGVEDFVVTGVHEFLREL